jgi:hypothetical protein
MEKGELECQAQLFQWKRQVLNVNQTISAALTLNVLEAVKEIEITEFSFYIVIIGTENAS